MIHDFSTNFMAVKIKTVSTYFFWLVLVQSCWGHFYWWVEPKNVFPHAVVSILSLNFTKCCWCYYVLPLLLIIFMLQQVFLHCLRPSFKTISLCFHYIFTVGLVETNLAVRDGLWNIRSGKCSKFFVANTLIFFSFLKILKR